MGAQLLSTTAERPFEMDEMWRMREVFEGDRYHDLAKEMWDINDERLALIDASRASGVDNPRARTYAEKSMRDLQEDRTNARHMLSLLLTMDPVHVRGLINGTFAFDCFALPDFVKKLYVSNANSGSYTVTFSVRGKNGKGLAAREIKLLYFRGLNVIVPDPSDPAYAQKLEDATLAAEIEMAYQTSKEERDPKYTYNYVLASTKRGNRKPKFGFHEKLLESLDKRMAVDPDGRIRQEQCLIQIGCSTELASRLIHHDPDMGLGDSTAKPYSLILRCLELLKILVESVRVPLVKVWEEGQLYISEIFLTQLASSLFVDGGMNCSALGGRKGKNKKGKWYRVKEELIVWSNTFQTNLESSKYDVEFRKKVLDDIAEIKDKDTAWTLGREARIATPKVESLQKAIQDCEPEVEQAIELLDEASTAAIQKTNQLDASSAAFKGYMGFHNWISNWLAESKETSQEDDAGPSHA